MPLEKVRLQKLDENDGTIIHDVDVMTCAEAIGCNCGNNAQTKFDYYDAELPEQLLLINMRNSETNFKVDALQRAQELGLKTLFVELFDTVRDIDQTKGDGASFITDYWDEDKHIFIKNDNTTKTLYSVSKNVPKDRSAWAKVHWEDLSGLANITVQISRNGGGSWLSMTNDQLKDFGSLPETKVMVCKLTITGACKLKNIAWGCK